MEQPQEEMKVSITVSQEGEVKVESPFDLIRTLYVMNMGERTVIESTLKQPVDAEPQVEE